MKGFLVSILLGEMPDYYSKELFVIPNEYQAKFYCSRAQAIVDKYKEYYEEVWKRQIQESRDKEEDYCTLDEWLRNRIELTNGIFKYYEIEYRSNIKIK